MNKFNLTLAVVAALVSTSIPTGAAPQSMTGSPAAPRMAQTMETRSGAFKGVEVNGGFASLYKKGNRWHLKASPDFKIPTSPAPHWQVIDSRGNVYLLQRLTLVGDKTNLDIALPSYIQSVAKVQIWCSFAEVNLGEASFAKAVNLR